MLDKEIRAREPFWPEKPMSYFDKGNTWYTTKTDLENRQGIFFFICLTAYRSKEMRTGTTKVKTL